MLKKIRFSGLLSSFGALTLSVMTGGERIGRAVTNDVALDDGAHDALLACS